ncbi:hypothetical protein [Dysgonomonas capnocytophagoides]|uniref:hypothetical protein n=1 Tax=Dysgonomonas capnocytophagoides TaxID=45254 RepID=UPI0030C7F6EF
MARKKQSTNIKKTDIWIPQCNRFVAFIDILGFKDRVMRSSISEVSELLLKMNKFLENSLDLGRDRGFNLMNERREEKEPDNILRFTTFSDSIVIFSKDDSEIAFSFFCQKITQFIEECLKNEIPLKGAIAHGEIYVNQSKLLYCGQPLIDAYLLEEELQYMGIITHHSIDKYIKDLTQDKEDKAYSVILPQVKTPLKGGKLEHRNLYCFFGQSDDETEKILEKFRTTSSGIARKYVDNSIEVFKAIKEQIMPLISELRE